MIAIIDYGMGNIHSVNKALQLFGAKVIVTNKPEDIASCEKVVLPGVGAFDEAMSELKRQNLVDALKKHIAKKKAFLGICLGMQLLFQKSQEARESSGLGVLAGTVEKFKNMGALKVPHMGWNQLKICAKGKGHRAKSCPLLKDISDNSYVYFCHSYFPKPADVNLIAAATDYGESFASIVWQDNICGVQFHPEKSQAAGLKMLENFVKLC